MHSGTVNDAMVEAASKQHEIGNAEPLLKKEIYSHPFFTHDQLFFATSQEEASDPFTASFSNKCLIYTKYILYEALTV